MKQKLSMSPYPGTIYLAQTKKHYQTLHYKWFGELDYSIPSIAEGLVRGEFIDGHGFIYVIWASTSKTFAHEASHAILNMFQNANIDPREANGEPFCYLLSSLMKQAGF